MGFQVTILPANIGPLDYLNMTPPLFEKEIVPWTVCK